MEALSYGGDIRMCPWVIQGCFPGAVNVKCIEKDRSRLFVTGIVGNSGEVVEFERYVFASCRSCDTTFFFGIDPFD